jgi:hypothetical protein
MLSIYLDRKDVASANIFHHCLQRQCPTVETNTLSSGPVQMAEDLKMNLLGPAPVMVRGDVNPDTLLDAGSVQLKNSLVGVHKSSAYVFMLVKCDR